jgi:hypothetical protein
VGLVRVVSKRIAVGVVLPTTDSCVTIWWGWAPRTVPSSSLGWFQRLVLPAASWPVSMRSQSVPSRGCDVKFGTAWASRGCFRVGDTICVGISPVGVDRGTIRLWSQWSVVMCRTLIYPCVLFQFKFDCLKSKTSRFAVRAKKGLKNIPLIV